MAQRFFCILLKNNLLNEDDQHYWSVQYSNHSMSSATKNLTTEDLHVLKSVSHFETRTELSNERVKKWLSNKDASKKDYLDMSINSEFKQSYGAEIYDEYQHQFLTFNTKGTGNGQNVIV